MVAAYPVTAPKVSMPSICCLHFTGSYALEVADYLGELE